MGRVRFYALVLAALYLGASALLYFMQDRFIFFPQSQRVAPTLAGVEAVEIKTNDNERLVAWYAEAEPSCPTFLFFHGNGGRVDRGVERYRKIAEKGAGFLALSWRGYAGSTGRPSEKGFHKDADAAWAWLMEAGVPSNDVIVHGFSIGTGPASKLALDVQPGMLVMEAPYYSMSDLVAKKVPILPTGLLLRHTFRSDQFLPNVQVPVFMAHGVDDSVIPISQSKRLFERANAPKQYLEVAGAEHNTLPRDGLYDALWPFIKTHWSTDSTTSEPTTCLLTSEQN